MHVAAGDANASGLVSGIMLLTARDAAVVGDAAAASDGGRPDAVRG